jgi:hypothetical protein
MAAFTAIQPIADMFLFFIPLYYSAKLAFAIYLWANELKGAELVYRRYVQPFVAAHEPTVDAKLAAARTMVADHMSVNMQRAAQWAKAQVVALLAQTHQAAASVSVYVCLRVPSSPALAGAPPRASPLVPPRGCARVHALLTPAALPRCRACAPTAPARPRPPPSAPPPSPPPPAAASAGCAASRSRRSRTLPRPAVSPLHGAPPPANTAPAHVAAAAGGGASTPPSPPRPAHSG